MNHFTIQTEHQVIFILFRKKLDMTHFCTVLFDSGTFFSTVLFRITF
jgi:hypothetical protein